jgi:SAM-dependent methyltransferase
MRNALYESKELSAVTGPFIRPGALFLTEEAIKYCAFAPGSVIVDVGCGSCGTVEHLRNFYELKAYGIDPSERLLADGHNRAPLIPIVQGVAEALPLMEQSLDGVFCECVFSLVSNPDKVLREFLRVLKPKGFLVITDVYLRLGGRLAAGSFKEKCCIAGARPRDEIEERLGNQGFSELLWEDHTWALKELAAQLILSYGSLSGFWPPGCSTGASGKMVSPGYFLLIARKPVK